MKIAIVGIGYVGLSNAVLLAQHNEVIAVDVLEKKVRLLNEKISPIADKEIQEYLHDRKLNLTATTDSKRAYKEADFIIISTPTNYDHNIDYFDTSSIEAVMEEAIQCNDYAYIVIKSTVPVGYTKKIQDLYSTDRVLFSPEFLREGKALYDNLYPSRIIVGTNKENKQGREAAEQFIALLKQGALKKEIDTLIMDTTEAEAVKLFANTYLAMRVAFFNELDTYSEVMGLDTKSIIEGICKDPRIGRHYNNPSFGYGGYCLPKDTLQLMANFDQIPNAVITAIVNANSIRKDFICDQIIKRMAGHKKGKIGIYRLIMKADSDNFRESAIIGVMERLADKQTEILIYEPAITNDSYMGHRVVNDLQIFKEEADIIVANRWDEVLNDVAEKVYSRDLYGRD